MKRNKVRKLVENYTIDQLVEAEQALVEGEELSFEVEGQDAGEKLTYLLAAVYVLERVKQEGIEFHDAFQQYTLQVRESI
ncbi:DUF6952 family protein [Tunicatimonas pelagia]|uniref:DUF6952 family protein n=1 Tax=Tunicatimonas pelagia TaxID=931531 RepID=UPI0026651FD0|nr:hypothetical protein [Tunicatimonas pelagia]WKN44644.1 hypothetical protein P0M28_06660 [Tunicatimonas pelagia]